jgi:hypothetical protein
MNYFRSLMALLGLIIACSNSGFSQQKSAELDVKELLKGEPTFIHVKHIGYQLRPVQALLLIPKGTVLSTHPPEVGISALSPRELQLLSLREELTINTLPSSDLQALALYLLTQGDSLQRPASCVCTYAGGYGSFLIILKEKGNEKHFLLSCRTCSHDFFSQLLIDKQFVSNEAIDLSFYAYIRRLLPRTKALP